MGKSKRSLPAVRPSTAMQPWRGDEHRLQIEAASEAGLDRSQASVDSYTEGFKRAIVMEDPFDGAIVARGRTVLKEQELARALRPALQYLGVQRDSARLRVHDGSFELRLDKASADHSQPALQSAKLALQVWIGFGLLGLACYQYLPTFVAGIVWGVGLMLGGWQLKQGLISGRAMLSGRLAIALGMLAHEEQLILPPVDSARDDEGLVRG